MDIEYDILNKLYECDSKFAPTLITFTDIEVDLFPVCARVLRRVLRQLARRGHVENLGNGYRLTKSGREYFDRLN